MNGITDKYLLSIEIAKDNGDAQLEVTCKTGDEEYKKHYKVQFRPEELLPDVDVQVSGGDN